MQIATSNPKLPRVDQILVGFSPGDAASQFALSVKRELEALGLQSQLYAEFMSPDAHDWCRPIQEYRPSSDDSLIFHYTIGSETVIHTFKNAMVAKRGILYQNITPAHFFAPYQKTDLTAQIIHGQLEFGRNQLESVVRLSDFLLTVSEFNARELRPFARCDVDLAPIFLDENQWLEISEDEPTSRALADGAVNFLFTGRIAPNKCQEDVIRLFAWYHRHINVNSRLILVGKPNPENYFADLRRLACDLGIDHRVWFTGYISQAQLLAIYRNTHLFVSMSEHEGFGVPLLEAMRFDIPILAYAAPGVAETLSGSGIVFNQKNFPELAELCHLVVTNAGEIRTQVLAGQKERLTYFSSSELSTKLRSVLHKHFAVGDFSGPNHSTGQRVEGQAP